MPYTVSCSPAPLTFTIRPRFDWHFMPTIAWLCFIGYQLFFVGWRNVLSRNVFDIVIFAGVSLVALLSLIRRERIEIYPDQLVWRRTYFGITWSNAAPLVDLLGAEWKEGEDRGRHGKGPAYVEFCLPAG